MKRCPKMPILDRARASKRDDAKLVERAASLCSGLAYARYGAQIDYLDQTGFVALAVAFDMGDSDVVTLVATAFRTALENAAHADTSEIWALAASMLMNGEVS